MQQIWYDQVHLELAICTFKDEVVRIKVADVGTLNIEWLRDSKNDFCNNSGIETQQIPVLEERLSSLGIMLG